MPSPTTSSSASNDSPNERLEPAEELLRRWEQGEQVDAETFLKAAGPLSAGQLAAVLRLDQRQRWQAGERPTAESYLQRHWQLATDAEAAVDLIFHEFLLRQRAGEDPAAREYADRFPAYADMLQSQIEFHRLLEHREPGLEVPSPAVSTVTNLTDGKPRAGGEEHAPIGFVARGGMSSRSEVQSLLRRRLRLLSIISCAAFLLYLPVLWTVLASSWGVAIYTVVVAETAAFAALLSARRTFSMRVLRGIESCVFAGLLLFFVWQTIEFFRGSSLEKLAVYGWIGPIMAARSMSWSWAVMIIVYGIWIPNTARRCMIAVAIMISVFLALTFGLALSVDTAPRSAIAGFLLCSATDIAFAAAIAVFGAYRIAALQRAASEARKLGPYKLVRRLGAGGMGEVYLAEHALLRRPCALMLIRQEQGRDERLLSRFEREVQAMAALAHPNTVRVYDYGLAADGTFYYAMEYLPGLSLQELVVRHGPLPPERVVHLLRQVCGALSEAHAVGLVHRDIKPANILACQTAGLHDVAKLLDFGLVRVQSLSNDGHTLTGVGTIAGTPAFMSPEQAAGAVEVDVRSDIYSLGAVGYFLLTGRPPFVHSTSVETMAAHLSEPVVPPCQLRPGIHVDLEEVVLRCLQKEPQRRFADVTAVDDALARCACRDGWSREQAADWWRRSHEVASKCAPVDVCGAAGS